ncbi:unnamed protein product [Boreogadus saida]
MVQPVDRVSRLFAAPDVTLEEGLRFLMFTSFQLVTGPVYRSIKCTGNRLNKFSPQSEWLLKEAHAQFKNSSWVAITAESAIDTDKDGDPAFLTLRNPTTDAASLYLFSSGDLQPYEVKAFTEDCHSWLIGQTVQRDGRLLYITLMDPLYLMLPYLVKAAKEGKFQPLDQVVMDEEFPACSRLLSCARSLSSVHLVAEEKGQRSFL